MAKKYKGPGKVVRVTAPADVVADDFVIVGQVRGIALHAALSGQPVDIQRDGVWERVTTSSAITAGARVYHHTTNKTVSSSNTGSVYIGTCPAGKADGLLKADILLDESSVAQT